MRVYEVTAIGLGINDAHENYKLFLYSYRWHDAFKQLSQIMEDCGTVMLEFKIAETDKHAFDYNFKSK